MVCCIVPSQYVFQWPTNLEVLVHSLYVLTGVIKKTAPVLLAKYDCNKDNDKASENGTDSDKCRFNVGIM